MIIPAKFWAQYQLAPPGFWRGDVEFHVRGNRSEPDIHLSCFDLRLDPADVEREFPDIKSQTTAEAKSAVPAKPPAEKGKPVGRPPAWWREPLLIELAGQLHDLTIEPNRLADLERAAKDWLGAQGEFPGERTVRNVVTPLWARISQKGKNPKE